MKRLKRNLRWIYCRIKISRWVEGKGWRPVKILAPGVRGKTV